MEDKLVRIDREHWQELRDLHIPTRPETYFGYCLLDSYIRCFERDKKSVDVVFYSLNGDWSDGLFLAVWELQNDRVTIFVNSLNDFRDRIARLLRLIDFSRGIHFRSIGKNEYEAVLEIIKVKNIQIEYQWRGIRYYLRRSDALKLHVTPPEGITFKSLSTDDVRIANGVWPTRRPGSQHLLQTMANLSVNVGAYDTNGKMIAWALRWHIGSIAALQVDELHKGQGLGALIAKAISYRIAEMGHDVCANVKETNKTPQCLFEKLGFTSDLYSYWVETSPTN